MVDSPDGIRTVVLRRNEGSGLGFSIMGGAGYEFPPVIYGIEKDSPAARSGLLEAGDIILAINEREVVKLSTKEVLKCLRLSGDIVNIKYKRDAQVVNRVRQFLSTPSYTIEASGDFHHHHQHHRSGSGKSRQSPLKTSSSSTSPASTPSDRVVEPSNDFHSSNNASNPNNISFSDDIFINRTHSTPTPLSSSNSNSNNRNSSPSNGNKASNNKNNWKNPASVNQQQGQQAKKSYEAFVMTGDAILNISRIEPNDVFRRASPTKTKLTPMSIPPHQIYTDLSCKRSTPKIKAPSNSSPPLPPAPIAEMVGESNKDISESSEGSPPLPPPPKSSSTSTSNSTETEPTHVTVKSDNLPPPPPSLMTDQDEAELLIAQAQQSQSNGNGFARVEDIQQFAKTKGTRLTNSEKPNNTNGNNNNEDTSISSSVMSDSGEELEDDEERPKGNKKKNSTESKDKGERERYNEYILMNGKSGPVVHDDDEDEDNSTSSASSARAKGYQKIQDSEGEEDEMEHTGEKLSRQQEQIRKFKSLHSTSSGAAESFNSSGGDSDGSDVESMRVAPVTKAVDVPSAERLAKRLYALDGFKISDVWRQLSKANDFSRTVATEYLSYFEFKNETLDISLRKFLNACPLRGETTEKERVLTYFSTRYVECNPDVFASQDAVHTLACALMLLNSDMYSGSGTHGRRMTSKDFIQNLSGLNDGDNFPENILRKLYHSIKSHPLTFPDADDNESNREVLPMDPSVNTSTKEFKRGYLKKKSIFEAGGKKTPLGKRSWKMFFCRLRDLVLVLSVDETSKVSISQNTQTIKLHHAHATVAHEYQKRPYVFQLTLADRSQYLFQSSDVREMNSWIDNINLNAARFSSPALEAPCGSHKRFERPLLPSAISRLAPRDQLLTHQGAIAKWEEEQDELNQALTSKKKVPSKREVKEREAFYSSELKRYKSYVDVLERHLNDKTGLGDASNSEELIQLQVLPNPPSVLVEMDE